MKGALNRGWCASQRVLSENYDTLLAVLALKQSFKANGLPQLSPNGIVRPTWHEQHVASTDRFGDFIFSSQVYTNARDLARFGLLHLNRGEWQGSVWFRRVDDFMVTPAPSAFAATIMARTVLVPDNRKGDLPASRVPESRAVRHRRAKSRSWVVRRGLDFGRQGFDRWELLAKVIAALAE